jgi:ferric-dicitrate binding protein FerR (iron transport regulator)
MFTSMKTDWSLLAKYLAGETSEKETTAILKWIATRPENRELFNELKNDWKRIETMNKQFNVDNAWDKLHNRIAANEGITGGVVKKTISISRKVWLTPMRIAAAMLVMALIGASMVFITGRFGNIAVVTAASENMKSITLPDGSVVYLNANTRFSYSKRFGERTREVTLDGEAFFEVTPGKDKPFVIRAKDASIRVVGTSFNVYTGKGDQHVEVYVSSGIVELFETKHQENKVQLNPGDIGTLSKSTVTSRPSENENNIAWKTRSLDFQDVRLSEAAEILGHVYQVEISFRGKGLDTTKIMGSYQSDPLDTILNIICTTNHLKIEKSDNKIYLSR